MSERQKLKAFLKSYDKKKNKKRVAQKSKSELRLDSRKVEKWANYRDYTNSRAFKIWKIEVLRKAKYKCSRCNLKAEVAHHVRYRKWGTEKLSDGIALCNFCHLEIYHADKRLDQELDAILQRK